MIDPGQRHPPPQLEVLRLVDHRHPAAAEFLGNLVPAPTRLAMASECGSWS